MSKRWADVLTTTEELRLEAHVIKRVDGLVIVGLDLSWKWGNITRQQKLFRLDVFLFARLLN